MSHPKPHLDSRLRENDERGRMTRDRRLPVGIGKPRAAGLLRFLAMTKGVECDERWSVRMRQLAGLAFSRGFLALGLAPLLSTRPAFSSSGFKY